MDISRVDLNLLVYLDVLLRECNVTKAANHLGITQPAMSNGLRRLRELFGDPLLVRTSEGMTATERARELQPVVRSIVSSIEQVMQGAGAGVLEMYVAKRAAEGEGGAGEGRGSAEEGEGVG